jgi:hypothetical protein
MTSIGRRVGVLVGAAAMGATAFGALGPAAHAAAAPKPVNPCKVVRRSEIQKAFGGVVSTGKQGFPTPASSQCEYTVTADGDRPPGTVTVHLTTTGAQAAYDKLEKSRGYDAIDGLSDALSATKLHVVNLLKGDVLVAVQGGFTITNPLPIHSFDDSAQLTQLAQAAAKRV